MGRCSDARDRLLATMAALLHERGYTALSVSDICASAGLKKGSFYHFFESKQALALAALESYAEHNRAHLREMLSASGSVHNKLEGMFKAMYEGYRSQCEGDGQALGCPIGNLAGEMAGRNAEITAKLESIFGEWREGLRQLLTQGVESGELDVTDPAAAAESLVAFLEGAALLARTMSDPEIIRRTGERALSLLGPPIPAASA
ncbi:MAG: TetR/AcrR family transcriptional regulator [Nannocystaceae bacterium]|nr:TetR/AcrR family transcriptional regulator [Nannocystaceae bacterium]